MSARPGRALRSVHAPAGGSSLRDLTPWTATRARCRRSRSRFPDLERWRARAIPASPTSGDSRPTRAGPARHDPGADARQRSVRRDRNRLAAARGVPPDARHADADLRQRRRLPHVRPRRSLRVALRRRGLQPAVDGRRARRPAADRAISRAPASCGRVYDATDYLLDLHSMTDPCPPLALAGQQQQGAGARARDRHAASTSSSTAGTRPGAGCATTRSSTIPPTRATRCSIECGQHWERAAPDVAQQATLRFLRHFGMVDRAFLDAHLDTRAAAAAAGDRGHRRRDDRDRRVRVRACRSTGSTSSPKAGTLLARDGDARDAHALRRLRADHADAAAAQGRNRGAHRIGGCRIAARALRATHRANGRQLKAWTSIERRVVPVAPAPLALAGRDRAGRVDRASR